MRRRQVAETRRGSGSFRDSPRAPRACAAVSLAHDDRAVMAQIGIGPARLARDRPSVQREAVRRDAHRCVGPVALDQRVDEHERFASASPCVARALL